MKDCPPIGMAVWLLEGGRLIDRVEWLAKNGFSGVSLLQHVIDVDPKERQEAAAAVVSEGLWVTYHGNVHHKLKESGELDMDFALRLTDDVLWWHENTRGVGSCCSDPIHVPRSDGTKYFDFDMNRRHMKFMAERLGTYGIPIGIENSCGGAGLFCSVNDIVRFKDLCRDIPMGMLLDAAHANIHVRSDDNGREHQGDVAAYLRQLPFEFLEVHFCDNQGLEDEHKYLGYGNLDLPAVLRVLKDRDFTGKFTVEVCFDRLGGKSAADIRNPAETDGLLISRDKLLSEWSNL